MPVKVTKKVALQSVAKVPTPSPNKEESIKVKVKDLCYPSIADMGKYKGALVLNPVIDWLEFGSSVPKADLAELEDGFKSLMHHEEAIKVLSPMEKLGVPKSKGYGFAGFWTGTAKEDGHVLIKFAPAKQQSRYFVICMNPSQMTAAELEAFWTFWDELFPYHPYLHRKALLAAPETILRVDIAVDLLGVEPQSVVAAKQAGKSVKKKVQIAYQSVSGRLETKYLPHAKGEGADEYFYDKRKERLERGADYPYGGKPMTRFEFRLETDRPVNDLAKLGSHFDKFSVSTFDRKALQSQPSLYKLFVELALVRSLSKVLDMLATVKEKSDCKNFFTQNLIDIWMPDQLRTGWRAELMRIGLLNGSDSAKTPKKKSKKSKKSHKK